MTRAFIVAALMSVSLTAYSQDSMQMSCAVAGYFDGAHESFYEDLARGAVARDGAWETVACKNGFEKGRVAGKFYRENQKLEHEDDREIAKQAAIFRAKVRRFILDGAGI